MKARLGTSCTTAIPCNGSITKLVTASTVPAPTAQIPTLLACVAAKSGTTIISPFRILPATPRKPLGVNAPNSNGEQVYASSNWRCGADLQSISAATGSDLGLSAGSPDRAIRRSVPRTRRPMVSRKVISLKSIFCGALGGLCDPSTVGSLPSNSRSASWSLGPNSGTVNSGHRLRGTNGGTTGTNARSPASTSAIVER